MSGKDIILMKDYLIGDYRDALTFVERTYRGGLETFHPAIITCAITGSFQGKEINPNLPESVDEQVQAAVDAYNAGAAMVHIHARQPQRLGEVSADTELYAEINRRIRERCPDLIINNTAMGGRMRGPDGQLTDLMLASIPARPEVSSLDLMLDYQRVLYKKRPAPLTGRDEDEMRQHFYVIQHEDAMEALDVFDQYGVMPEYELFDTMGIKMLRRLIAARGEKLPKPYWVSMLFGGNGTLPSVSSMMAIADLLPREAMLNIIGVGAPQIPMIAAGLLLGHNVRVGLEDNVFYGKGRLAAGNGEMVERAVRIAREIGRPVATPAQAREMMGLGAPRQYN